MKNLIIFFSIVLALSACNDNNDDCSDLIIAITSLENEYGCTDTRYSMKIDLEDDYIVIKNQVDFERLVTGSCLPNIDFETYDLVIGRKSLSSGNESVDYELRKNCESETLTLKITFNQNLTAHAPTITYHALIPKIKGEQKLNVKIEETN